jgi:hypothetical protein
MAVVLAGAIRMVTLLTSAGPPPAAQIFNSATDMYGYYNTTNNTNLSGLERIHDAFSQVHNTTCCFVIYYQIKPVRLISLLMRELSKRFLKE